MFKRLLAIAALAVPLSLSGANKEITELQRDLSLLHDEVRTMQRTVDALQVLVQQTLDASNKNSTAIAVLDNGLRERMRDQEKVVAGPVLGLGAKVDQMASEFGGVRESITDMASRMGKLQQQIVDLSNTVKVMQAPPAPPAGDPSAANQPPVPAESLYSNAMRDKTGGRADMALQGFQDYLKFYGNTDLAPNAQFYIGEIRYSQADFESALPEFDAVLEKYPENNKTADALYMKGQTLVKMNRRNDGAKEYRELVKRYPDSELAAKARAQLKAMGLSTTAAPAARRGRR